MLRHICLFYLALVLSQFCYAQSVPSPAEVLGYQVGERFTHHHRIHQYFKEIAAAAPEHVRLTPYGSTYEERPLFAVAIGSRRNIQRLEAIRRSNLARTGLSSDQVLPDQPAIIWLSYNIHGNEAAASEAALLTAYEILSNAEGKYRAWLDSVLIIIDPCLNPDGHSRYVQFYSSKAGRTPDLSTFTQEHQEPWPGGRPNHYLFDLNRDWAWQTQKESVERVRLLNSWMPQVHVDFHEMGINSPYYFAPSAEPIHQDITSWQRKFQEITGQQVAYHFDERNWLYFTSEIFDLFYPSYGDTYPSFNGAVGMTYEQGGSGQAGLSVLTDSGDTLTLADRAEHHHVAGLATIEATGAHRAGLLNEFDRYFARSRSQPPGLYKGYVIRQDHPAKRSRLISYLDQNGIQYQQLDKDQQVRGFCYRQTADATVSARAGDLYLPSHQPKSVLLKVLFEPQTFLPDSNTYDITAWSLPYAWGLDAIAVKTAVSAKAYTVPADQSFQPPARVVAYAFNWSDYSDVHILKAIWQADLLPRIVHKKMRIDSIDLQPGTILLILPSETNKKQAAHDLVARLQKDFGIAAMALRSAYSAEGPGLGTESIGILREKRVGLLSGQGISPGSVGEVWHLFDQQWQYPVHLIDKNRMHPGILQNLDVLILPSGNYSDMLTAPFTSALQQWISDGGKLICLEQAINSLIQKEGLQVSVQRAGWTQEPVSQPDSVPGRRYADQLPDMISRENPGAIIRVSLDNSHPLAYGYGTEYFSLKTNSAGYAYLPDGWNVATAGKQPVVSGFVGSRLKQKMEQFLVFGAEDIGQGQCIYFCDNPLFRSFWDNGKLFFANAVFISGR